MLPIIQTDSLGWNEDGFHSPHLAGLKKELPGCCWSWNNISDNKSGVRVNVRLQISTALMTCTPLLFINLNSLLFKG